MGDSPPTPPGAFPLTGAPRVRPSALRMRNRCGPGRVESGSWAGRRGLVTLARVPPSPWPSAGKGAGTRDMPVRPGQGAVLDPTPKAVPPAPGDACLGEALSCAGGKQNGWRVPRSPRLPGEVGAARQRVPLAALSLPHLLRGCLCPPPIWSSTHPASPPLPCQLTGPGTSCPLLDTDASCQHRAVSHCPFVSGAPGASSQELRGRAGMSQIPQAGQELLMPFVCLPSLASGLGWGQSWPQANPQHEPPTAQFPILTVPGWVPRPGSPPACPAVTCMQLGTPLGHGVPPSRPVCYLAAVGQRWSSRGHRSLGLLASDPRGGLSGALGVYCLGVQSSNQCNWANPGGLASSALASPPGGG